MLIHAKYIFIRIRFYSVFPLYNGNHLFICKTANPKIYVNGKECCLVQARIITTYDVF